MEHKIIEFTNLLRKSGVRVSVAESIDAFVSIDELSLGDREVFKDALRCTMVKRSEDIGTFDQLFDLYWSAFHDSLSESFDDATGEMGDEFDLEALMKAIAQGMQDLPEGEMDLSELAKALLTQDLDKLEQLIRDAADQAGTERIENMLQLGFFTRRTMEQMEAEGAGDQLRNLAQELRDAGMGEAESSSSWSSSTSSWRPSARASGTSPSASSSSATSTTWRSSAARASSRRASTT